MIGSYHRVSAKHLQRYIAEYLWRPNHESRDLFDLLLCANALAEPMKYRGLVARNGSVA